MNSSHFRRERIRSGIKHYIKFSDFTTHLYYSVEHPDERHPIGIFNSVDFFLFRRKCLKECWMVDKESYMLMKNNVSDEALIQLILFMIDRTDREHLLNNFEAFTNFFLFKPITKICFDTCVDFHIPILSTIDLFDIQKGSSLGISYLSFEVYDSPKK